jgi:dGTPase
MTVDPAALSRSQLWAATMNGTQEASGVVVAHRSQPAVAGVRVLARAEREELEALTLADGATRAEGAGRRARAEEPDPLRTCFERDRDRILHSTSFRRLAGKTQVFVYPHDHQRTRLTHALEVAQVATAVARAVGLNTALTEAIALGHDCGHGPGGHASEDAFSPFVAGGYNHAVWGADVSLVSLNLCAETLDGIRHHSWSLPSPLTPEGAVVSWADRCAYTAHDLEDAVGTGIVAPSALPAELVEVVGATRSSQLRTFIRALVDCITETGAVGMQPTPAAALAGLREFNYRHIYTRPEAEAQGAAVVRVLQALVSYYAEDPSRLPPHLREAPAGLAAAGEDRPELAAVAYVAGMTDRYAFESAVRLLGWPVDRLPRGIDVPA